MPCRYALAALLLASRAHASMGPHDLVTRANTPARPQLVHVVMSNAHHCPNPPASDAWKTLDLPFRDVDEDFAAYLGASGFTGRVQTRHAHLVLVVDGSTPDCTPAPPDIGFLDATVPAGVYDEQGLAQLFASLGLPPYASHPFGESIDRMLVAETKVSLLGRPPRHRVTQRWPLCPGGAPWPNRAGLGGRRRAGRSGRRGPPGRQRRQRALVEAHRESHPAP